MRRRLKNFLPIVLFALAVQIFAPIAACWAAGVAASDPLGAAIICHGNGAPNIAAQDGQTAPQDMQRGCCTLCGTLHTGAPVALPQAAAAAFTFDRTATQVVWHEFSLDFTGARTGSPEQARAPPVLS